MNYKIQVFLAFCLTTLVIITGCEKSETIGPNTDFSDEELYVEAIKDAMIASPDEICNSLIAISDSNNYLIRTEIDDQKHILVTTWTSHPERYSENLSLRNTWGEIWVTVVPEMEEWFTKNYSSGEDYVFRAEKLLGLPKNNGKTHFVEIWVNPEDLWRPSPDNGIHDTQAQIELPQEIDSTYLAWFNNTILYSYYPMRYPWTRLGYTYDWDASTSEVGLSEFVIKPNSRIRVHQIRSNEAFFSESGT